jgi:hypothetical protein
VTCRIRLPGEQPFRPAQFTTVSDAVCELPEPLVLGAFQFNAVLDGVPPGIAAAWLVARQNKIDERWAT